MITMNKFSLTEKSPSEEAVHKVFFFKYAV